jgi:hypothetical protein
VAQWSCLLRADTLQIMQNREVSRACRVHQLCVGQIGDCDKADMGILAVESAPGQRFVEVLEPVGADKVGVVGDRAEVARVGRAAFAFSADTDEPLPEQPAVDRAEMELADQRGLAKRMKPCPFGRIIGDRASVAVEADDIAPSGAGLDRFRGLPGETAAERWSGSWRCKASATVR